MSIQEYSSPYTYNYIYIKGKGVARENSRASKMNNLRPLIKQQGVATYFWFLVIKEVVMISYKPSLPPVRYDTTTTLFVEPAHFPRVLEGCGCWTVTASSLRVVCVCVCVCVCARTCVCVCVMPGTQTLIYMIMSIAYMPWEIYYHKLADNKHDINKCT